jgi:hypothetical protein
LPVLAGAIRLGCEALLTGDRSDFGPGFGKTFDGVTARSPARCWNTSSRWTNPEAGEAGAAGEAGEAGEVGEAGRPPRGVRVTPVTGRG